MKFLVSAGLTFATLFSADNLHAQFAACTMQNRSLSDAGVGPFNYTRVAVRGAGGRPLIVYTSDVNDNSSLYLYDCDDANCTAGHSIFIDKSTNYSGAPGIVIRGDGRPAVVATYLGGLKFYDCSDVECATVTSLMLRETHNSIFKNTPVVLQANGNPAVAYVDGLNTTRPGQLILRKCDDVGCATAGTEVVLATPPQASMFSFVSLSIGSDGSFAAAYLTTGGPSNLNTYNIARCSDASCASIVTAQMSQPIGNTSPSWTALTIRSDERPLALDNQASNRALLSCTTSGCATTSNILLPATAIGTPIGIGTLTGDIPAFALFGALSVGAYACADVGCTSGTAVQTTSATSTIRDADFVLDAAHGPAIAYIDAVTKALAIARCANDDVFVDGFDVGR